MTDSFESPAFDYSKPVPAARALTNFTATEVGEDEIVLFDHERMTYHTMNQTAFRVWQRCDGNRSQADIVSSFESAGEGVPNEYIDLAVSELSNAGLLESAEPDMKMRINRRRVLKMAAAGGLGAAAIPVVSSITAPVAANTTTCGPAGSTGFLQPCACSSECASGCCINESATEATCISLGIPAGICVLISQVCFSGASIGLPGGGSVSVTCLGG